MTDAHQHKQIEALAGRIVIEEVDGLIDDIGAIGILRAEIMLNPVIGGELGGEVYDTEDEDGQLQLIDPIEMEGLLVFPVIPVKEHVALIPVTVNGYLEAVDDTFLLDLLTKADKVFHRGLALD